MSDSNNSNSQDCGPLINQCIKILNERNELNRELQDCKLELAQYKQFQIEYEQFQIEREQFRLEREQFQMERKQFEIAHNIGVKPEKYVRFMTPNDDTQCFDHEHDKFENNEYEDILSFATNDFFTNSSNYVEVGKTNEEISSDVKNNVTNHIIHHMNNNLDTYISECIANNDTIPEFDHLISRNMIDEIINEHIFHHMIDNEISFDKYNDSSINILSNKVILSVSNTIKIMFVKECLKTNVMSKLNNKINDFIDAIYAKHLEQNNCLNIDIPRPDDYVLKKRIDEYIDKLVADEQLSLEQITDKNTENLIAINISDQIFQQVKSSLNQF